MPILVAANLACCKTVPANCCRRVLYTGEFLRTAKLSYSIDSVSAGKTSIDSAMISAQRQCAEQCTNKSPIKILLWVNNQPFSLNTVKQTSEARRLSIYGWSREAANSDSTAY